MKKRIYSFLMIAALAAACTLPAAAQNVPGLYTFTPGGTAAQLGATTNQWTFTTGTGTNAVTITNIFGAPGTSSNFVMNVSQCDYAGFTWSCTGIANTTNVTVKLFKSFDNGNTFEAVPSFVYGPLNIGAASFKTNASLDIHGVTHLALVTEAASYAGPTNQLIELNLKAPLVLTVPPGNQGKTPGTPIAVPNFP
ncbi:MAG: hypothetical protein ABFD89_06840 [Bryobacteraceae bacterium]